jgi:OOP family OmpA-OmpF porin
MYQRFGLNGFAVLCLLAGGSAYAEQDPGFFVGAGVGQATVKFDEGPYNESDTGFKAFGGYNFNSSFGAELAYIDGGKRRQEAEDAFLPTKITFDVAFKAVNLSLSGRIPLNDTWAVFGKIGYARYEVKSTYSGSIDTHGYSFTEKENVASYGGGATLSFGKFDLRAEYEAININSGDFDMISLSGVYRF